MASDGSFKDNKGTLAWVIKGEESRLVGYNWVPGEPLEQSAYRSELAGLLAAVTIVDELSSFNNIIAGKVTVGCDNISALDLAFDTDYILSTTMADHDILLAIRNILSSSKVEWHTEHIKPPG